MTALQYTLSGSISWTGPVRGERAQLELDAKTMMADIRKYAREHYPQYLWDESEVSLYRKGGF